MSDIKMVKDFRLSVKQCLKSIESLISDEDSLVEYTYMAGLIEMDFDYLLSRLRYSEKERFSENQ